MFEWMDERTTLYHVEVLGFKQYKLSLVLYWKSKKSKLSLGKDEWVYAARTDAAFPVLDD